MIQVRVKKTNFFEKIVGLIGAKKAYPLLINTRFGIHTFGVRFPIDVIVLDTDNKVVKLRENLKPNRFFFWDLKYNNVLELPKEYIKDQKMKLGEILKIESF